MYNLYNRIAELCQDSHISVTALCKETNISRSALSELKAGRTKELSADNLFTVAKYFDVPVGFFRNESPFDSWGAISADLPGFFQAFTRDIDHDSEGINMIWSIDLKKPEEAPIQSIISFLSYYVKAAHFDPTRGEWSIEPKEPLSNQPGAASQEDTLDRVYFNFAKYAQEQAIDPQDIQEAIEMIKKFRGS